MDSSEEKTVIPELSGIHVTRIESCEQNILGEGPVWHSKFNAFFWIDINAPFLLKWDPETDSGEKFDVGEKYTSLAPTETGFIATSSTSIWAIDFPSLERRELLSESPVDAETVRFNDGKMTPEGNYMVGEMENNVASPKGSMYSFGYTGAKTQHLKSDIICFNGPNWTLDGKKYRWADSLKRELYIADWNGENGTIGTPAIWTPFPKGFNGSPDGATVDHQGNVWWAIFFGGCVLKFSPEGELLGKVVMPANCITSCAFGGKGMKTLFVTSCSNFKGEAEAEPQGCVFAVTFDDENTHGIHEPLCTVEKSLKL